MTEDMKVDGASPSRSRQAEISLDPQDWDAMRRLGHRMVDDLMTYLETVRARPAWQRMPDADKARFQEPLPRTGQAPEAIYQEFVERILPYPIGNIHPRFWGWVIGTGTPFGMLAEMLAAGMNPNSGGADQSSTYVERQVLDWCKELFGFPAEASGLLLTGGSMANLVGMAVARNARAGFDVNAGGLQASSRRVLLYCSVETHSSVHKAARLLGLGQAGLRLIPVNEQFEIDLAALQRQLTVDRAEGHRPFCIIGNAGTVNTGAIDDLARLADICAREGAWFHVDGAFGALAALTSERARLSGMERADSLAFDLHKWLYMQYDVGCVLVRHPADHLASFSAPSGYLSRTAGGVATGGAWFSDFGPELSRCFRALKVWMSIKEHGIDKYAAAIQQNVDQARYLASLVNESPELELLAPIPLNIVCFRYRDPGLDAAALDTLNEQIVVRLHESGVAVPSYARIRGAFAIRVAIVNHRTRREDFELLAREVLRLGRSLTLSGA